MLSMLRFPRAARVALTFAITGACSAQLPREQAGGTPAADAPWAVDVRPVSETCRALAKPPVATAPLAKIAYQSLTTAKLGALVDIVPRGDRIYVVDKAGKIQYLAADCKSAPVALDISKDLIVGYG